MLRLNYGDNEVLISDAAGEALLEYARVLAVAGKSDSVELSVIDGNNETITAHLLIGPASQLVTLEAGGSSEIDDSAEVQEIRDRTARLLPDHVEAEQQAALVDEVADFDL